MPRKDRIRREWDDLMDSLVVGTIVNSSGLMQRLNGGWWTATRIGSFLKCDPRVRSLGKVKGHDGPMSYEVIG